MVNVGFTFLYCVLSCIQMYILMAIGYISYYRNILNSKNNGFISAILINYLIPIYVIVKLSQVVDTTLLNTYWILIVNFVVELIVGYLLSLLFHIILKMDIRIKECFAAMNMVPALGALPLVIAKGFCFPSGPVDGDPLCNDFLGLVMLCLLIFNFSIYVIAYFLFAIDKNKSVEIEPKLEILWHKVLNKFYKGKDITMERMMKEYMKKDSCFIIKEEKNELPIEEKEIIEYYKNKFSIIESNINKDKQKEYEERKRKIIEKLSMSPQRLPVTPSITINSEIYSYIQTEWIQQEQKIKELNPNFNLNISYLSIKPNDIIKKLLSPPLVAIILGIILSQSKIRRIVYSSSNNYWSNIVDGALVITQAYTPLLFGLMGLSCVTANTNSSQLLATKTHVAVLLLIRFLIMPFIGMFNIYMWTEYYGGIVKSSIAYRLLMYTHWCLPSASNMTLIISMTQYFGNEYGYLILISNMFCIIGLSILNLIYFVLVGL